jgi:hypothetical protein
MEPSAEISRDPENGITCIQSQLIIPFMQPIGI